MVLFLFFQITLRAITRKNTLICREWAVDQKLKLHCKKSMKLNWLNRHECLLTSAMTTTGPMKAKIVPSSCGNQHLKKMSSNMYVAMQMSMPSQSSNTILLLYGRVQEYTRTRRSRLYARIDLNPILATVLRPCRVNSCVYCEPTLTVQP